MLEFMLNKGAWVEGSNGNDDTVLHIAARLLTESCIKSLEYMRLLKLCFIAYIKQPHCH